MIALKRLVQDAEGYDIDLIGLEFAGKLLENDRTLADYHLQNESTLKLVSIVSKDVIGIHDRNVSITLIFFLSESWAKSDI